MLLPLQLIVLLHQAYYRHRKSLGLVFWNNHIIGVYNGAQTNKENAVVQYALNSNGDKITSEKIIDKGNELFHDPTTAAILGNKLYVLANSYLGEYNANKESAIGITDKLGPVIVIVYDLSALR